jgi:hypothetical protein
MSWVRFSIMLAVAMGCWQIEARAQTDEPVDRARALGEEAAAAFERGQWEAARSLYHRARQLYPAPTLGVREARCLVKLGRLLEAERVYERTAALPVNAADPNVNAITFASAQADARREGAAVRERIPFLTIRVAGPAEATELAVDGAALPATAIGIERSLDPGLHTVSGKVNGSRIAVVSLTLAEGEHRTLIVAAPTGSAGPPVDGARRENSGRAQRIAGMATAGAGAVALGLGIGFGVAATSKHTQLEGECAGGACLPSSQDTLDSFHTLRTLSTISYVAGGVLVVGGVVLFATAPTSGKVQASSDPVRVVPWVGWGAAGLTGRFQ